MSYITMDLVDQRTGEQFTGLVERGNAPEFGAPFEYEEDGKVRLCTRVPSIIGRPQIANYGTRALSKQRWHPAFEKHDARGFGITRSRKDVQGALDWSKRNATCEDDEWTWNDKDKL